jgi:uncharacterized membrane protein YjjB (DUF3815 family)
MATRVGRIHEISTNLSDLAEMDNFLEEMAQGNLSPGQALNQLGQVEPGPNPSEEGSLMMLIGAFAIGAGASHGSLVASLASGLLTLCVHWLKAISLSYQINSIFTDFLACLAVLIASTLMSQILELPPHAFAIGSLIMIVPGLTLTTAISELAEYNFVSGLVKIMRGLLTLLAMGTAYILAREVVNEGIGALSWDLNIVPPQQWIEASWWVQALGTASVLGGFALVFHLPIRYLPWAVATGLSSWVVFEVLSSQGRWLALASFLASFTAGVISLILGNLFRVPSQLFSVPGILSLVPGMLALSIFQAFSHSHAQGELGIFLQTAVVVSSIVFGLFSARIPFMFTHQDRFTSIC